MRFIRLAIVVATMIALVPASADAAVKKKVNVKRSAGTEVRSSPGDWVIGTANNNTAVWVQGNPKEGYWWAYIGGDFKGCAWISQASVTKGGAKTGNKCPAARTYAMSEFIGGGGKWWDGSQISSKHPHGRDGRGSVVKASRPGCNGELTAYANVHPIGDSIHATGPIATIKDGTRGAKGLLWRWITRDGTWVAVRDAGITESTSRSGRHYNANLTGTFQRQPNNWYFVKRDCLYLAGQEDLPG